jgi:hypothetical protein
MSRLVWEPQHDLFYAVSVGWGFAGLPFESQGYAGDPYNPWGGSTALPFGHCSLHGSWDTTRYVCCPVCSTAAPMQFRVYPDLPEVPPVLEVHYVGELTPHRCPICHGTAKVPAGFYTHGVSSDTAEEDCRTCENGVIWH